MTKLILPAMAIVYSSLALGQSTFKVIVKDQKTKEKLIGATAYISKLKIGSSTDTSGTVVINNIPKGEYEIVFSFSGYEKEEVEYSFPLLKQPAEIFLKNEDTELSEVIVTSTRTNSRIEDVPIKVEVIGEEEVNEEGSMKPSNISMLLQESPGIQAQQTSATNGNVSIRMLGLDGKYTQVLQDGFPLYGGFAQGLSIMQIPPLDLKQVEIIKGSASSLYGSDAIGGIINLITKQPTENRELTFVFNQTSLLGSDANAYFSQRWRKFGFSLMTANSFQTAVNVSGNGFSDLPDVQTFSFKPTFYYFVDTSATVSLGLNGTLDNRKGGDMQVLKGDADSLHRFYEQDITGRASYQLKFEKKLKNNKSFTVKNSISYFNGAINQPTFQFAGTQISSYSEASFNFRIKRQQFVTGINVSSEKFNEDSTKSHLLRNYNYVTTGLFLQDDWKPTDKLSGQAGFRTDYVNQFGFFALPRLALMYTFNKAFYVRGGGGYGYMLPTIFSTESEEQGINTVPTLSASVKPEKSIGSNLDFNYRRRIGDEGMITLNQSFFITQINDPLELEPSGFQTETKPVVTQGFESNIRYKLDDLQFVVGYTYVDARREYDAAHSFVPLTPQDRIVIDVIYEKEGKYSIALEEFYTSSMYRDYNESNTQPYFLTGIILQKHFKHFSIILNCENIFDVRQTRFENIIIGSAENPTFKEIYAPLDGRVFNIAVRIKL